MFLVNYIHISFKSSLGYTISQVDVASK